MSKSYQWQLMSVEELACACLNSNAAFRRMKTHYKKQNNAIMSARFEQAETLAKPYKSVPESACKTLES